MKLFCLSAGLIGAASASIHSLSHLNFEEWKEHHDISFNAEENEIRRWNFEDMKKFVIEHNKKYENGESTFHVAMNKFAAMTNSEFVAKYTMPSWEAGTYGQQNFELSESGIEEEDIDGVSQYMCPEKYSSTSHSGSWSGSAYTTMVKDQGSCGSCWSFGAAAAMEGSFCKSGVHQCSNWNGLSTQQLVDCASFNSNIKPYDNNGCGGGFQSNAMYYVINDSKGIESWDDYPYKGQKNSCAYKSSKSVGTIKNCGRLSSKGNQDNMASMLQNKGITTVAIDASGREFQTYSGGIYTGGSCSSTRLNHAVTATGFTSNSLDIKNSWGTGWGDKGYIHFAKDGKTNTCGVYSEGQYGIV